MSQLLWQVIVIGIAIVDIMKILQQQHVFLVHHDNIVQHDRLAVVLVRHDSSQIQLSVDVYRLVVHRLKLVLVIVCLVAHHEIVIIHIQNLMDVQIR